MADSEQVAHLLRRAGFGATPADLARFETTPISDVVDFLVDYDRLPDDVDTHIGQSDYVGVTAGRGPFSSNTNIDHARQRWLFRMVHSQRPLQEKMTLFWHNHFATAYSKVTGFAGAIQGTKMMALTRGALPGPPGQIELLREYALDSFRTLLFEVARDPAMVIWLDGRTNLRRRPQENFAREIMELFTWGVGNYTEEDVYEAARVFTGWNLSARQGGANNKDPNAYYEFFYNPNQHDTSAKSFTFPIYRGGDRTIPARSAADGMRDGVDFISALAAHPETARRLARKLWGFFISEIESPDPGFVEAVASEYLANETRMKPVIRYIFRSPWMLDGTRRWARYSWPAEHVARAIRELGWAGFSVDAARTPFANMGHTLFEPPDVAGWSLGADWISTGSMLARMNFAATLASNQRFNLSRDAAADAGRSDGVFPEPAIARADRQRSVRGADDLFADRSHVARQRCEAPGGLVGIPVHLGGRAMKISRREFVRDGVAAFTVSFAAPAFLSDIAQAQGARSRSLVVVYLRGGNDALNTVIPYLDPFYYSRRPAIAIPAGQVLQIGSDPGGTPLGLHPRLTGLRTIFNEGRLAIVQRTGYANSSRSHFQGVDIWGTADPSLRPGWDGWAATSIRCLRRWTRSSAGTRRGPHRVRSSREPWVCRRFRTWARTVSPAPTPLPRRPTSERPRSRCHRTPGPVVRTWRWSTGRCSALLSTLDRVASWGSYAPTVTYPSNGFALALRTVAASIVGGIGTRVYWVSTGGFDTHAGQGNAGGGVYATLMSTFGDGLGAFYTDLQNQGLLNDTLILQFSEFGRRIPENGSEGADHGSGGAMMAVGGSVRGGLYGTSPSLDPSPSNPSLENSGRDVRYDTDFRAVYARVLEGWLGTNSTSILGGDFLTNAPAII